MSTFLDHDTSTETVLKTIGYLVDFVGAEHVGLGLDHVGDVDGLSRWMAAQAGRFPEGVGYERSDLAFVAPEQVPQITDGLLSRGYDEESMRRILGENWTYVSRQVWKTSL